VIEPASITVVVPLYNGAPYIREVSQCLAGQTQSAFKVLYIDDGSKDASAEIVAGAKRELDQVVTKPNSGLYDTLNVAAGLVETEWTALLFQDDHVAPTWIERMSQCLDDSADCLWFGHDQLGPNGELVAKGLDTARVEMIPPSEEAWRSALRRGTIWTISGSVVRTQVLRSMRFRPDLPHCGDYEFLLRGLQSLTFVYVEEPQVAVRIHPEMASTANLASGRDIDERLLVLKEQLQTARYRAPPAFRAGLATLALQQILLRTAGALRQGRLRRAWCYLTKAPKIFGLLAARRA
jgi:glycosyltransferase involved in cell wall biosynthesis